METSVRQRSKKAGLPPGTMVHIGEPATEPASLSVIRYGPDIFSEHRSVPPETLDTIDVSQGVTWIHIDGVHDLSLIEKIGAIFNLHTLLLEDIVNTRQRPKVEDYNDHLYIVMKTFDFDHGRFGLREEQVSFILGPGYVISLEEKKGDIYEPVRERLRQGRGKIRSMGADFLVYSLIDAVVDSYFSLVEGLGDNLETLEALLVSRIPTHETITTIHRLRRNINGFRGQLWPTRELLSTLERSAPSPVLADHIYTYFRDVHDHVLQIMDTIELLRESLSGMLDLYLSRISNRLNEIMKVLTVIATIFMPLTFIAGVYGMNFKYMPELSWPYGYYCALAFMGTVSLTMILYFRKKKWL